MPDRAIVEAFIATVVSGRHAEAIEDFYAETASMQENLGSRRVGRDVLVAHERAFLERMARVVTHPVERWLLDGDRVVINWVFEVTDKTGVTRRLDELAIQQWEGDKIVREQFYYDPAAMR
jgi:ketosteroid isomerase-like protein